MRNFMLCAVLGLIAGCASKQLVSPKASVKLEKSDVVELQEAFKTAGDKVIQLPTRGEVSCVSGKCTVPLEGTATVLRNGASDGTAKVMGNLVVDPTSLSRLVSVMEQAARQGKTLEAKGRLGDARCAARYCELEMSWEDSHDTPLSGLVPATRIPASDQD